MGCTGCSTKDGRKPNGCNSNGGCSTGGCNRLNTFDWLNSMDIIDVQPYPLAEVSFKNGVSKDYFRINPQDHVHPGDMVLVEGDNGWDVGRVNLVGELVKIQLKKKRISRNREFKSIIRHAGPQELEKLSRARAREKKALIRARAIAKTLNLDMKISDVEFQADQRKAVFYFIANGRIDFRELIKHYASEFQVKIEMKQIGSRQESALVGGIGSCGRELCCSTWLSNFKSVNTSAARYQNLAINQAKLSGQCGRLKCCLNYELDHYMEALKEYPQNVTKLKSKLGLAYFAKIDIFKKAMYYSYKDEFGRMNVILLSPEKVREIAEENKKGVIPDDFGGAFFDTVALNQGQEEEVSFEEDLTGVIELPPDKRKKRKKRPNRQGENRGPRGGNRSGSSGGNQSSGQGNRSQPKARPSSNPQNKNTNRNKPSGGSGTSTPPKA